MQEIEVLDVGELGRVYLLGPVVPRPLPPDDFTATVVGRAASQAVVLLVSPDAVGIIVVGGAVRTMWTWRLWLTML